MCVCVCWRASERMIFTTTAFVRATTTHLHFICSLVNVYNCERVRWLLFLLYLSPCFFFFCFFFAAAAASTVFTIELKIESDLFAFFPNQRASVAMAKTTIYAILGFSFIASSSFDSPISVVSHCRMQFSRDQELSLICVRCSAQISG